MLSTFTFWIITIPLLCVVFIMQLNGYLRGRLKPHRCRCRYMLGGSAASLICLSWLEDWSDARRRIVCLRSDPRPGCGVACLSNSLPGIARSSSAAI